MECEKVNRFLSGYLDNSLKVTYRNAIKEHLAKCHKCMDELNTMTKIDNLLKLKVREKPSKEYWENYWQKLESRLDRTATLRLSGVQSSFNRFISKFAFALNGILIALLIFLSGLLHIRTQQMEWLQYVHEKTIEQISTYLLYPATRATTNVKTNALRDCKAISRTLVSLGIAKQSQGLNPGNFSERNSTGTEIHGFHGAQFLDKYDMLTYNYHSKFWSEISSDVASEEFKNGVKNAKKEG
ncbi:MAG: zf-HC2 domain-containing protein [Candidatus Omnitrophica bacterium]|nr:zf-HC2 domain-containing protein [Candidatus Omnitrophota bacterium]MBU1889857.1 zf-HC2 domain-containing protein [Candidatus Omnitrophota bacterium]